MSEFIELLSPSALADLQKGNAELLVMIKNVDVINGKMKGITTPSGSDSAIKGLTTEYQKQEKVIASLQSKLEIASRQQQVNSEKTRLAEIKLAQQREQTFDKYEKQLAREQAKLSASSNIYNKLQAKLTELSNEYKSLAVQKELSGKLTDSEAKRYDFLLGKITKYDATLKAVDATMGKHQRNVGNYASGFNPLSNSINQLTREMPAFTYSVQTGFMALSNNIPIFTDAIGNAIKQNKLLQAEGKPTTSVLKQLAGAFFGWQTLMGIGITLLTVYGKEIGEFISKILKQSSAIDSVKESQKQLNDVNAQGQKNAVEETIKLKSLLEIAKDTALSYKERMIAVEELQSTYPAYFGNLKQEEILAGNTTKAENALTDAILSRAKANAAVSKITENQALIIDIELKRLALRKELDVVNRNILATEKSLKSSGDVTVSQGVSLSQTYDKQKKLISEINELSGEKSALDKVNNVLTSFAIEKEKESILLKYKSVKATKDATKAKKEQNKEEEEFNKNSENAFKRSISALEAQIANTDRFSESYDILNGVLKLQKNIYDQLFGSIKNVAKAKEEVNGVELTDEQVYQEYYAWLKLKQATDDYIKTISSDAFNKAFENIGLSSAKMFLDFDKNGQSTFDKLLEGADTFREKFQLTFQSVGDVAQDVFNKMNEMSNQHFETQLYNLEREKNIALAFAGDSVSGREAIEQQFVERQREIKRREFKAKKQLALFNIAIDTAQAVVAALPNIPLSIAIGAIGIVQAGIVASKNVPEFWKGTDNAPEGWAWTQEKGAEIITDKNGKVKSTGSDKGAQMTYLNKGDKVFTAEKSAMMFDAGLNGILTENGISSPKVSIENKIDLSGVINAIKNKSEYQPIIDKNGFNQYVKSGHSRKEETNRRITFSGRNV